MNSHRNRITSIATIGFGEPDGESRLLGFRVVDLTRNLVTLVGKREWPLVARVLVERRALLERMPQRHSRPEDEGCLIALRAAMAESDRTVGLLLASAELRWPDSAGIRR